MSSTGLAVALVVFARGAEDRASSSEPSMIWRDPVSGHVARVRQVRDVVSVGVLIVVGEPGSRLHRQPSSLLLGLPAVYNAEQLGQLAERDRSSSGLAKRSVLTFLFQR